MWLTDAQKIGCVLSIFGFLFMLLGVILFFDGALLAIGNLLFISGLTLIIGPTKTLYFFARKQKLRGTFCFLGGVALIFLKWPIIGISVEAFGFINLFGDFFPVILGFLRSLPFVGPILRGPYIGPISDRLAGARVLPVWMSYRTLWIARICVYIPFKDDSHCLQARDKYWLAIPWPRCENKLITHRHKALYAYSKNCLLAIAITLHPRDYLPKWHPQQAHKEKRDTPTRDKKHSILFPAPTRIRSTILPGMQDSCCTCSVDSWMT